MVIFTHKLTHDTYIHTAMSTAGRAATLRAIADSTPASEFQKPGHIFLRKSNGGWQDFEGGSLELVRLAGGDTAAVCEILSSEGLGNVSIGKVMQIAESLSLTVTSVEDVESQASKVGAKA